MINIHKHWGWLIAGSFMIQGLAAQETEPVSSEPAQEVAKEEAPARKSALASPRLKAGLRKDGKEWPINGFYVAGFGSVNFAGDSDFDYNTTFGATPVINSGSGDADFGFGGGLKLGYSLFNKSKDIREFQLVPTIELEATYLSFDYDLSGEGGAAGTQLDAEFQGVNIVANGILKFRNDTLTPYAGFGGGIAWLELDSIQGPLVANALTDGVTGPSSGNTSQFVPVVQGIFGLEKDIYGPNMTVFIEYKAMLYPDGAFDLQFATPANSGRIEISNMFNQNVQAGLRWNF